MLASPTGIKFFRNRFKDHLLASSMTSLQNGSYYSCYNLQPGSHLELERRCLSSLALLSEESMTVGKVQTWPTAQHEQILAKSVAPGFCRVHGRCRGGPRLLVFTNPGVLKRSGFICLHWKQCFVFLPGPSKDKGSMSCQITEGIALKEEI